MYKKHQLSLFFIFLIIYTSLSFLLQWYLGNHTLYMAVYMWSPGLAVFTVKAISGSSIHELPWQWGKNTYQWKAFLLPFLYSLVGYSIIWIAGWALFDTNLFGNTKSKLGLSGLSDFAAMCIYVILFGFKGTLSNMATALGEEIGWRGFLLPRLMLRLNILKASFLTGTIWAVWHFPLLFKNHDYSGNIPIWYEIIWFLVGIISLSIIAGILFEKSKSLWTPTILHASHNLFVLSIFDINTVNKNNTLLYTGETGAVIPILITLTAFILYMKYHNCKKNNTFKN